MIDRVRNLIYKIFLVFNDVCIINHSKTILLLLLEQVSLWLYTHTTPINTIHWTDHTVDLGNHWFFKAQLSKIKFLLILDPFGRLVLRFSLGNHVRIKMRPILLWPEVAHRFCEAFKQSFRHNRIYYVKYEILFPSLRSRSQTICHSEFWFSD